MSESGSVWQRLERLGPERVTPGLERIRALLARLGDPHLSYPTAIVAGTNGKGSTVAMLTAIGRAAGIRVGSYLSPHVEDMEERFQVDGHAISNAGLAFHLDAVLRAGDEIVAAGEVAEPPSYFEVLTAVAFRYFAEAHVDLAILEVGLGGRFDATNVTRPRVSIITSIAVDHVDWLGDDIREIAREKFAVVPPGGVAVVAPQADDVMEVIRGMADDGGITLLQAAAYPLKIRDVDDLLRHTFDFTGRLRSYGGLELALPGRHQVENARCAILAAEALDRRRMRIASDAVWAGLRRARCPGRCQWFGTGPRALLDGAHNPAAAAALARYLRDLQEKGAFDRLHLVLGVLGDKDLPGITGELYPLADSLTATRPASPRAADPERLLEMDGAPEDRLAVADPEAALVRALGLAADGDVICVTGSLYVLGRLRPILEPRDEH